MKFIGLFLIYLAVQNTLCKKKNDSENDVYTGDEFPVKYLVPDGVEPTYSDFKNYLSNLSLTIDYFLIRANRTGCNEALGTYFTKSLLKKSLKENAAKLKKKEHDLVKELLHKSEDILSHYTYIHKYRGWRDIEYRVSELFREDDAFIYSIGDFTKGRLNKWLLSDGSALHQYMKDMDEAALPREEYVRFLEPKYKYHINIKDSDTCLSKIIFNRLVTDPTKLIPCKKDNFCNNAIHATPSVAYALSHRLLNVLLRRFMRRCYLRGDRYDLEHMDQLCAFMYRETVYLARRGFFARDMFLEHIALCGMMGHQEFFRHNWFRKANTWMNDIGCIQENPNTDLNRTKVVLERMTNKKKINNMKRLLKMGLANECHVHPMALLLIVLGHAIRHALEFIKTTPTS